MANDEYDGEDNEFLEESEEVSTEHNMTVTAGNQEADIYTVEGREELEESDEISPWEEGFSEGAEGSESGVCAHCGKPLGDIGDVVEREINGEKLFFCCDKCAESGKSQNQ